MMVGRESLARRLDCAEAGVSAAAAQWSGLDSRQADECLKSLQAAVDNLVAAQSSSHGQPVNRQWCEDRVSSIRAGVGQLSRLMDASAAFCRGLAVTSGQDLATDEAGGESPRLGLGVA
jgi:hypothetical protein